MKNIKINENIFTSILLIIAGIAVMILPGILSFLITAAGVAVILFSLFMLIVAAGNPIETGRGISGIIIGILIILIPRIIGFGIPLVLALILFVNGSRLIVSAITEKLGSGRAVAQLIIGILLAVLSIILIVNHIEFNDLVKRIIAGILIFCGIIRLIPGFIPTAKKHSGTDSVIDVNDYHVDD